MRVEVQKSFEKDIALIREKKLASRISIIIEELEQCNSLSEINHLKKMKVKGNYFRIRIGDYRIGLKEEKGTITLLRIMQRKEIYKYFP